MSSLPTLFSDLALILVTAGVTTVIFKWLKQPLVLGYIVAGFLIGPYFSYFPIVNDHTSVETWSEIGMVFLLFAIGLEFSFKKLKKSGAAVGITALTELISMLVIGFFVGKSMGWSRMDSIFLGAMLAMSSTTIIAKAFDDLKLKGEKYTESVIGVLVVEDIAAILMMVILSTLAVSKTVDGQELLFCMVKLVFFLLAWFIFGIYLIPSLLKMIRKFMNEETMVILSIGLCFIMVVLANYAGFSSALGAFIMGSILAETLEADVIHKLTTPIRNLFGAVFFVSVGMMVDPKVIVQYIWPIIIITLIVLTLKSLSSFMGMFISGQGLKSAIQAGFCFGQIGEFSFIIASVGRSYGVIDDFLYPIIVSVSVITTFITPYAMKSAMPFYNWLDPKIPERWKEKFNNKNTGFKTKGGTRITIRSFTAGQLKNLVLYATIIIALMLICFLFVSPFINRWINGVLASVVNAIITLALVSPFIWAMAFRYNITKTTKNLLANNKFNKTFIYIIFGLRYIIAFGFSFGIIRHFIDINFWFILGITFVYLLTILLSKHVMNFYNRIETRFLENLNKRQSQDSFAIPEILQENFHLEKMTIGQNSSVVGKRLMDTAFRSRYNVSVVSIERGDKVYDLPHKDMYFYPFDIITVVGCDENLNKVRPVVEADNDVLIRERKESNVNLHKTSISMRHPLNNVSLRHSNFKEKYNAMVIAIERDDDFNLNPSADTTFRKGDVIWFVCNDDSAKTIMSIEKTATLGLTKKA